MRNIDQYIRYWKSGATTYPSLLHTTNTVFQITPMVSMIEPPHSPTNTMC